MLWARHCDGLISVGSAINSGWQAPARSLAEIIAPGAAGDLTGEYDPEDDRVFNGDTLNCRGWLTYRKAARAGLVFAESGDTGGAEDSWRDQDYEDEMAYRKSLEEGQAGG